MASANTIDISEFQDPSTFDYQAAKDAGINTIIIRGSVSMRLDKHAKEHIANAKKYGFHWHLYHYYYGGSGEADYAVQAAQELGLSSSQYLFLDMEDSSLPTDWATPFEAFRQKAKSHFKVGLYCSDSPYQAKFSDTALKQEGVARWVASYSYEPKNYDIWQMSGAGSGGFGTYTGDVDRDYDKAGVLTSNSSNDQPKTPTGPTNPGYRAIVLEDGIDTDAGVYGRGYSYDNGKTFHVTDTTYGRKYRQEDGDRIAPFLKKYFNPVGSVEASIKWADILDKPDLALKSDIPSTIDWSKVTNKPDVATQDDLKKIESAASTVTTITSGTLASLATKVGVYHYEIDFIPSDSPTHDRGLLDVVVGANYAKQVFTNTANSDVYVRTCKQSVWSDWRQITLWN